MVAPFCVSLIEASRRFDESPAVELGYWLGRRGLLVVPRRLRTSFVALQTSDAPLSAGLRRRVSRLKLKLPLGSSLCCHNLLSRASPFLSQVMLALGCEPLVWHTNSVGWFAEIGLEGIPIDKLIGFAVCVELGGRLVYLAGQ